MSHRQTAGGTNFSITWMRGDSRTRRAFGRREPGSQVDVLAQSSPVGGFAVTARGARSEDLQRRASGIVTEFGGLQQLIEGGWPVAGRQKDVLAIAAAR